MYTVVCALLSHFTLEFMKSGLTKMWLKYGVGKKVRFVPLHKIITPFDQNICDALLKVLILTRCDVSSKNGTKFSALKSNSCACFGKNKQLESSFVDAEMYLIRVLQSYSISKT